MSKFFKKTGLIFILAVFLWTGMGFGVEKTSAQEEYGEIQKTILEIQQTKSAEVGICIAAYNATSKRPSDLKTADACKLAAETKAADLVASRLTPAQRDACRDKNMGNRAGYNNCIASTGMAGFNAEQKAAANQPGFFDWVSGGIVSVSSWLADKAAKTAMTVIAMLLQVLVIPTLGWLTRLTSFLLDNATQFTLDTNNISNANGAIVATWVVVRNLFNITFIFVLLYTAIRTIIGSAGVDTKKMIANVIIAALLINFSLFITRLVIDFGNIIAVAFYNAATNNGAITMSTLIADTLGLGTIWGTTGVACTFCSAFFIVSVLQIILMLGAIVVFLNLALLMVVRTVMLIFLLAFSPLGFVGDILPKLAEYAKMWRENLYGQVMIAPTFLLFFYLIIKVGDKLKGTGLAAIQTTGQEGAATIATAADNANYMIYFKYVLILALLFAAAKETKKLSGIVGSAIEGVVKTAVGIVIGAVTGGAAVLFRGTVGRGLTAASESKHLADAATSKRTGAMGFATRLYGRTASNVLAAGGKKDFDLRNTGGFKKTTDLIGEQTGIKVDYNRGAKIQKGGYTGMQERRVKEEEEFAKRMGRATVEAPTQPEIAAKQQELLDSIKPQQAREAELTRAAAVAAAAGGTLSVQEAKELKRLTDEIKDVMKVANDVNRVTESIEKERQINRVNEFANVAETGLVNKLLGVRKDSAKKVRAYAKSMKQSDKDKLWDLVANAAAPTAPAAAAPAPAPAAPPPSGTPTP